MTLDNAAGFLCSARASLITNAIKQMKNIYIVVLFDVIFQFCSGLLVNNVGFFFRWQARWKI